MRVNRRQALAALVVVAGAAAVVVVRIDRPAPTQTPREAVDVGRFTALVADGDQRARLVDLCDDEDANNVLDGGALEEDRANLGVACNDPDGVRYVGYVSTGGGDRPLFTPRQFEQARVWVERQNARIEAAEFSPTPDDVFSSSSRDANGCRSEGLKKVPKAAYRRISAKADIDGDGEEDRVSTYIVGVRGGSAAGTEDHTRIELATGTIIDTAEHYGLVIDKFYRSTDRDRDGRAELWIEPNTNKPGAVTLLVFDDCKLKFLHDGEDRFFIHTYGDYREFTGLTCVGDRITWTRWSERVDDAYGGGGDQEEGWIFRVYRLDGTRLIRLDSGNGDDLDSRPKHIRWGGFDCAED